ncbi:MAG: polysaccharide biosynthesis tyrosine autokinase [Bacteroidaceae bacterium]|nr:polysaccharide biosynthesis tyrosine autokinase [Bacteroidaceae bacterium]
MADYIDSEKERLEAEESSGFDFRKLWSIVILNWYWIIFSTLLCVAAAYVYLRYQAPVYQVSTKIIIKDEGNSRGAQELGLEQMGVLSTSNGFENEMEIITSTAVATRAVKNLKLYVTYTAQGRVRETDLYKSSPILIDMEESRLELLKGAVVVELTKQENGSVHAEIKLPTSGEEPEIVSRELTQFPCVVNTRLGKLMFSQNPGHSMTDAKITATIVTPSAMGRYYSRALSASPTSKMTTVAVLSLLDTSPERAADYLAQLVQAYNDDANADKNEVARNTEDFIKNRLDIIRGELDETEGEIEGYKRNNALINLPTDASSALSQSTEFQKRQVDIQTQMSLVKSLLDYVHDSKNCFELIPANIGITNQATNTMVSDYNNLVLKRHRLIRSSSESALPVTQITDELSAMWDAIGKQLQSIYQDLNIQKKSIDDQYNLFAGKVSSTPTQERAMNNMGRQQEIKAGLYLMLLQKREENYITQASVAAKARIIDTPQLGGKVSPKGNLIMLAALLFGMCLPVALLYLREMFRFHIEGRNDLESLTNLSILADIPLTDQIAEGERAVVVKENKNNMMEEAFRGLRTNLRFVLGKDEKVVCTTSSMPGEGKTFVATNLAMSLALLGKKVLIMGLDIRKPRLVKLFGLKAGNRGISTYLAADTPDFQLLEEQIEHGVFSQNLDVLPAGVIPPNPGELITRETLDQAIAYLKTKYDYIILDTPPVGLVSDTMELGRLADVTFFVVRSEVTTKGDIELINRTAAEGKLPKINLVLNGVDLNKRKYGFYYGYGKYSSYSKYGTYYGRYGHYGTYGNYGEQTKGSSRQIEK